MNFGNCKNWIYFLILLSIAVAATAVFYIKRVEFYKKNIQIALDARITYSERLSAASKLTPVRHDELQNELLRRLPGEWDNETYIIILLLSEIGDEKCLPIINKLRNIARTEIELTGSMNRALRVCEETIKKNHLLKKVNRIEEISL